MVERINGLGLNWTAALTPRNIGKQVKDFGTGIIQLSPENRKAILGQLLTPMPTKAGKKTREEIQSELGQLESVESAARRQHASAGSWPSDTTTGSPAEIRAASSVGNATMQAAAMDPDEIGRAHV